MGNEAVEAKGQGSRKQLEVEKCGKGRDARMPVQRVLNLDGLGWRRTSTGEGLKDGRRDDTCRYL